MLLASFNVGHGIGDYPAVAPNGDFETRRAWGEKEMFEYFELADKWVRKSSLIAEDVGAVTGVAPIGSPNRFYAGGFSDGSFCAMNLQVIGLKGEGVLTMPEVNVNNMLQLYQISANSTWSFEGEKEKIMLSGKSWFQESTLGHLFEQIRDESKRNQHQQVVGLCELFNGANGGGLFGDLPFIYRVELLRRYAESLCQLGHNEEALEVLYAEAETHLARVEHCRYRNPTEFLADDIPNSLEAARAAIIQALELSPEDKKMLNLAGQRLAIARRLQCDSFKIRYKDDDEERNAIKRSLGDLYGCVVSQAKKSKWLQDKLGGKGGMAFQLKPNYCNNIHVNKHRLYEARVVTEITGTRGRHGTLEVLISENKEGNQPLDLNVAVPREPRYPFAYRAVFWTDSEGKKTSLSPKTLAPHEKK